MTDIEKARIAAQALLDEFDKRYSQGALSIGLLVQDELSRDGKMWRRRETPERAAGVWITFCATALRDSNGIRRFCAEWEREP